MGREYFAVYDTIIKTANYDKSLILRNYGPDLGGDLSIFPEEITAKEASFSACLDPNLFDTDGYMILECSYDKPEFDKEIIRLQGLFRTIEYEGEQFTNEVLYDEQSYKLSGIYSK